VTCDERRDLLLLYVSDGLEPAEAKELREHLQSGCPACAGHLAEAEAVMANLPLALDRIAPPPNLKERLMERIAAAELPVQQKPAQEAGEETDSIPMRLFRYLVPAAVAAGLAIIATHAIMNQRVNDLQQQATTLRRDNQAQSMLTQSVAQQLELLSASTASQNQVVDLLRSPDLKLYSLKPQPNQPHAVCNLLWDKKQQQWAILTDGMTPAPPGQTYELWFITKAGTPVAAGIFNVDASGRGSLRVDIPAGIGSLAQAAVTNETGLVQSPKGSAQIAGEVE
jgi:anti-sigma-K factor RskA